MTVMQAISEVDNLKPNQYSVQEKIRWLDRLDRRIKREILDRHEGMTDAEAAFDGYTEADVGATLLASGPYEELYPLYLQSQVDFYNAEYGRYNNSAAMFEEAYSGYADAINRARMPIGARQFVGLR